MSGTPERSITPTVPYGTQDYALTEQTTLTIIPRVAQDSGSHSDITGATHPLSHSATSAPAAALPSEPEITIGLQIELSWNEPKLIFTGKTELLTKYLTDHLPETAHIQLEKHSGKTHWTASFARLWRESSRGALQISFLGRLSRDEITSIIDPILNLLPKPSEDAPAPSFYLTLDDLDPDHQEFINLLPDNFKIPEKLALSLVQSFLETALNVQTERNKERTKDDQTLYSDTYEIVRPSKRTRAADRTCAGFGALSAPFATNAGAGTGTMTTATPQASTASTTLTPRL